VQIKNLLKQIIDLNQSSKRQKKIGKRIFRGRSASIANDFENMFARMLDALLPDKYSIFVDYPISYKIRGRHRTKTSYPDLAVIANDRVLAGIIELKIDLGYLPHDWTHRTAQEITHLRKAKLVSYKTNVGTDKAQKRSLNVSPDLPRAIVVLTGQNDHGKLNRFLKQRNCFVLSKDIHPNDIWINDTNRDDSLRRIIENKDNIESWKAFANFLDDNFS
jgi:hypothetical protein